MYIYIYIHVCILILSATVACPAADSLIGNEFIVGVPQGKVGATTPDIEIVVTNVAAAGTALKATFTVLYDPVPGTTPVTIAAIASLDGQAR